MNLYTDFVAACLQQAAACEAQAAKDEAAGDHIMAERQREAARLHRAAAAKMIEPTRH